MDRAGEVIFCPAPDYRERCFSASVCRSSANHSEPALCLAHSDERLHSVLVLWLLSGGRLPRDAAIRARPAMGRGRWHFSEQYSLHLWSLALVLLFPLKRSHVRRHLRYR